jgi:hypothetical protein
VPTSLLPHDFMTAPRIKGLYPQGDSRRKSPDREHEAGRSPGWSATRAAIARLGIEPKITTLKEYEAVIAEEGPRWAEIVRVTGIKAAQ